MKNTGTVLRLCACLGIEAHIIEPAGFPTSDRAFRRAGMDYLDAVTIVRHGSWRDFATWRAAGRHRLVLFTTGAAEYRSGFYGPGKYDGSVVNWVNGPLLQLFASRRGFDVRFSAFTQRPGSRIKTLTVQVRD